MDEDDTPLSVYDHNFKEIVANGGSRVQPDNTVD